LTSFCLQPGYAQRAAKYAAILAFFAIDPEPRNRLFALRTLRDYVVQRRSVASWKSEKECLLPSFIGMKQWPPVD
jgi:hypothetical protein